MSGWDEGNTEKRIPRIAVIGSANVDLITFGGGFPRSGETVHAQHFEFGFGGKGANQAVAARLCGAQVVMIAKVGSDRFGEATINNLSSLGIDTKHVRMTQSAPTGAASIYVEPGGQNRIIVIKGANDQLTQADVEAAGADLQDVETIIVQFEIPLETVYHTVKFARLHKIRCIVNPAPALPASLENLIDADYFIPNELEAEIFSGCSASSVSEAQACASVLLEKGFRRVVITLGARGSLMADSGSSAHIPAFQVKTVDTTGAGDALVGSFAVFLAEGSPEKEALTRASLYAALSSSRAGAQASFPARADFEEAWRLTSSYRLRENENQLGKS